MPLKEGVSNATRQENIEEMIAHGHDPKVAVAASYEQQRRSRKRRPGRPASDAAPQNFALHDSVVLDAVHRSESGYLAAEARCARVGTQRYRGSEVGLPERETVTLYRPEAEVFNRDAMHSMAHRPVTLKHPPVMVNSTNWAKYAKGHTLDPIVRDGDFVKVPIVLMDQAIIDAVEGDGVRELSMGYTTDISWEAGETPDGERYDGVQRAIRANHLALVPVARGGQSLRFGDAGAQYGSQGASLTECSNCGSELTGSPLSCPNCGADLKPTPRAGEDIAMDAYPEAELYDREFSTERRQELAKSGAAMASGGFPIVHKGDLANAIKAIGRAKNPAAAKAHIIKRARALGATSMLPEGWQTDAASSGTAEEEGVMPIIKTFDGIPIQFADEVSAATMEREVRKMQQLLADQESNFKGKKAKPFGKNGNGGNGDGDDNGDDDDADDIEARRKKVTAEDALKVKDGEIAVLRKQLADAGSLDARAELLAEQRIALLDAAKPLLPQGFNSSGKSLADIRRAAVATQFSDNETKDWDDAQFIGAFAAMTKTGGADKKRGATALADGMTNAMRASAGSRGGMSLADAEADADKAYGEYVQRLRDGYKTPFTVVRN